MSSIIAKLFSTRMLLTCPTVLLTGVTQAGVLFEYVTSVDAPYGVAEIVAYDKASNQVFTTYESGIDIYDFGKGSDITVKSTINLKVLYGDTIDSVSSVAIDPLGRGLGAATVILSGNTTQQGQLVLFDVNSQQVLNTITTGYNPDMVTFSPDGGSILVANEGEASTDPNHPFDPEGTISILDVKNISLGQVGSLSNANLDTFNFAPANLVNPSDLQDIRIDPRNKFSIPLDLEPEYISVSNGKAYVSLQENNAVGVFDLEQKQWTAVHNLGGVTKTIDASDVDSGANIDDQIFGLFIAGCDY